MMKKWIKLPFNKSSKSMDRDILISLRACGAKVFPSLKCLSMSILITWNKPLMLLSRLLKQSSWLFNTKSQKAQKISFVWSDLQVITVAWKISLMDFLSSIMLLLLQIILSLRRKRKWSLLIGTSIMEKELRTYFTTGMMFFTYLCTDTTIVYFSLM
jgi:hypothetical protein